MKQASYLFYALIMSICVVSQAAGPGSQSEKSLPYAMDRIVVKFHAGDVNDAFSQDYFTKKGRDYSPSIERLNKKNGLKAAKPVFRDFRENRRRFKELLNRDKGFLSEKERRLVQRGQRAAKGAKIPDLEAVYVLEFDLAKGKSILDVIAEYSNDPDVEYAEADYKVSLDQLPNDPYFGFQWSLHNTGQLYPSSGKYKIPPGRPGVDIDVPKAWDIYIDRPVVVAVIDSGVDYNHRDLVNMMWINEDEIPGNKIDDDGNGYIDDYYGYDFLNEDGDPIDDHGHGTHCAGIIGAEQNNGLDISGVCPTARIMPLKFIDPKGEGFFTVAAVAFYYAVENGAEVLSNSWGGKYPSRTMELAIEYAHSQGVIITASAGNDNYTGPHYPSDYHGVISVAATDSNDNRAPFSNYGQITDIAAPGVDILSLRAEGTSMGTIYDEQTTTASGTSMACPLVSGVCAMLVSIDPDGSYPDSIEQILKGSADPISPEICVSGRLNSYKSLLNAFARRGQVSLDKFVYSCNDTIGIELRDPDLKYSGSSMVTINTWHGDIETVKLFETDTAGVFCGAISTGYDPNDGTTTAGNGIVELLNNKSLTVTYFDSNDGFGKKPEITDFGYADCNFPELVILDVEAAGPWPKVKLVTNEPASVRLFFSSSCGGPYQMEFEDAEFAYEHILTITPVLPYTDYYFVIEITDTTGNVTVQDNSGVCYSFRTNGPDEAVYVPTDYGTIQDGVDHAWEGGTVCVLDGRYAGSGNKAIDLNGKAMTVRSQNGPENCIIDCMSNGRAFYFHSGEDSDSVVTGFTIDNASSNEGAIYCLGSSPTINNCVIKNSTGKYASGIYFDGVKKAAVTHCTIIDGKDAPAMGFKYSSDIRISDTVIARSSNTISDGGALYFYGSKAKIVNCTLAENSGKNYGGGLYCGNSSSVDIVNSIIWGNTPDQIYISQNALVSANYSDVQGGYDGQGNIDAEPLFWKEDWGDYRLKWNSQCIDSGTDLVDGGLSGMDLDGNARQLDGDLNGYIKVDMGAYEYICSEIQKEINMASEGETVVISPGVYHGNIRFYGKNINLRARKSGKAEKETVIVGTTGRAAVTFADGENADCTISGFAIRGGSEGILCYGSSPTISKCSIVDYGETAIELWHESEPKLKDLVIDGDVVTRPTVKNLTSGRIYDFVRVAAKDALNGDVLVVNPGICPDNVTVSRKNIVIRSTDPNDPAIVAGTIIDGGRYGDVILYELPFIPKQPSILRGLTITNGLYGVNASVSGLVIENCIIRDNRIAGVYLKSLVFPVIKNCLIMENTRNGIESNGGMPKITNCTIVDNASAGIYTVNGRETISNSIIWGNGRNQFGKNTVISYSNIENGYAGKGNISIDPCFVRAGYWGHKEKPWLKADPNDPVAVWYSGDHHLSSKSPCIGSGDPNYIQAKGETDLDGMPRVIGGVIDMGVYEYHEPVDVKLSVVPKVISCNEKGGRIIARMILPQGFTPADVDTDKPAILMPGGVESVSLSANYDTNGDVFVMAVFERSDFCNYTANDSIQVSITGSLADKRKFTGSAFVQIKK